MTQEEIVAWKINTSINIQRTVMMTRVHCLLGQKYWSNFCPCSINQLSAKRVVQFDSNQDDWCTVHNFEQMYEKVYESMVNCGVVVKWEDEPWWVNHDGAPVNREEDAYGRKTF